MRFARRLEQVPPYLFAEIERRIERLRAEGVDVISLGIGDPDLPAPATAQALVPDERVSPAPRSQTPAVASRRESMRTS